jgi:hypothetical protein
MKKIIISFILILVLLFNETYAISLFPYEYKSYDWTYSNKKEWELLELNWYITPFFKPDDAWWIKWWWFKIKDSQYSLYLNQNWVYWINWITKENIGNISNNPLWLYYQNKSDIEKLYKNDNLSIISKGLPIMLTKDIYNYLQNVNIDDLHELMYWYYDIQNIEVPTVKLKWKIKDFKTEWDIELCEWVPCSIILEPYKQDFIQSWKDDKKMSKEEFVNTFNSIWKDWEKYHYNINTKIFIAEEIIINWKNILDIPKENNIITTDNSYETIRKNNIWKLKENEIKVLNKLVIAFRQSFSKWKWVQIETLMKKLKESTNKDYKKINDIIEKYKWLSDSDIIAQNPSLTKLRENWRLKNTYYTILLPVLNEWLEAERKKIEENRILELKKILDELKETWGEDLIIELFWREIFLNLFIGWQNLEDK